MQITCRGCGVTKHETEFTIRSSSPTGRDPYCRPCQRSNRLTRRAIRPAPVRVHHSSFLATEAGPDVPSPAEDHVAEALVAENRATRSVQLTTAATDYVPATELLATWAAVQLLSKRGKPAPNMLFTGPSGSGKTEGARHLARLADLPFVKIDSPAIVDPETWFGTREVVVEDGAPKTVVNDSLFVTWLARPCVLLLDEVNRVSDGVRQILLALLDDSREVTNPLTGQTVVRHPECFIIMTANVGLAFTGTYAIDPAFLTRSLTTRFDYLDQRAEQKLLQSRTGISAEVAVLLARFASDTRAKARLDEDFIPVSTREVIEAAELASVGLDPTSAVRQAVINAALSEGGAASRQAQLEMLWTGIAGKAK